MPEKTEFRVRVKPTLDQTGKAISAFAQKVQRSHEDNRYSYSILANGAEIICTTRYLSKNQTTFTRVKKTSDNEL